MESNDELKEKYFNLDNILIEETSYKNILVYNFSYKNLIGAKALRNRFDKIDRFSRVYYGTPIICKKCWKNLPKLRKSCNHVKITYNEKLLYNCLQ